MTPWTDGPCRLCGARIGPDITDRPMCYGCGPADMMPGAIRALHDIAVRGGHGHWTHTYADKVAGRGASVRWVRREDERHWYPLAGDTP